MRWLAVVVGVVILVAAPNALAHPNACVVERDSHGKIKRSAKAKHDFMSSVRCPSTGLRSPKCPGYVVDHVRPLCDCGLDHPSNMQYQSVADAKVKDRWEKVICFGKND